jgi:ubiquitin carboxyl-terminal hydrolase 2
MCSRCKEKQRCSKRYSIERLPLVLVIHLKRFLKARYNNKITTPVKYPIEGLDMSSYVDSSGSHKSSSSCLYDLYAISLHSGTESSGHYIAYAQHPYSKIWNCFDDSR